MSSGEPVVYRALYKLLVELFVDTGSLSRFLHGLVGRELVDQLPGTTAPLVAYIDAAVIALESHGCVDDRLFQALVEARPRHFEDIRRAAEICGVESLVEPPRRDAPPRFPVDRAVGALVGRRRRPSTRPVQSSRTGTRSQWLVTGKLPSPGQENPATLLNARYERVPFHSWLRATELVTLRAWCERDDPVAVTVVAGPGGVGKTRLMFELCEWARERGFVAGFVPQRVTYEEFAELFAADARVLAVVDYAETRPAIGLWLARATAIAPDAAQRTRIVLVVRSLDDWWDMLLERGSSELHALLQRDAPIELRPEELGHADRMRVYQEAAERFSMIRGLRVAAQVPLDLDAPRFGRVLYLHMAALAAVEGRTTAIGSLLADTLRRERQFWSMELPTIEIRDDHQWARLHREIDLGVAAITLAGGTNSYHRADTLLARAGVTEAVRGPLLARLGDLYPGAGGDATGHAYLSPLEPDLLAEAHVAAVLLGKRYPEHLVARIFAGDRPEDVRTALQLLGRLAGDPGVVDGSPEWLAGALRRALDDLLAADLDGRSPVALEVAVALAERQLRCPLAEVMADAFREHGTPALASSLALRPVSHAIALRPVVEWMHRTILAAGESLNPQQRFASLIQLAAVKLNQEDRDAARSLIRDAVESSNAWLEAGPDALWPSAVGIGLLGLADGEVGELESAVERARDSLRYFEAIMEGVPGEEFEPVSLLLHMMYGLALLRSGARADAVGVFRAMEPRYARLAARRPGVRIPEQALCDFYLGLCLGEIGHLGESAVALRRAVAAQRALVESQRGSRLADLAWSLLFLCEAEERIGEDDTALAAGREAVILWEELHGVDPGSAAPGLALSLSAVASAMNTLGHSEDARATAVRGVEIWRRLAAPRPMVFSEPLATALLVLSIAMNEPGDRPAALAALDEALAIARPLAARSHEAFAPLVGRSLLLQGFRRTESGDDNAAVDALRESMATFRGLPDDGAAGFALERGLAALLLAFTHAERDEEAEAIAVLSEAIAALERAPGDNGSLHAFVMGTARALRAMAFAGLGDIEAAVTGFAASLAPLRAARDHHPDARGFLALALSAVARSAFEGGDMRSSESAVDEAIPIWRACIADGESNSDDLANDLILLAQIHRARDADDSARKLLLEAEQLIRGLPTDERSDEHDALAECVVMLADLETDPDLRTAWLKEAAALIAGLFIDCEDDPDELLDRLVGVAEDLTELGHVDDAAQILEAAVARATALLSEQDDDLRMSLTDALEALAEVYVERDAPTDVLKALWAAADLWRLRSMRLSGDQRDRFIEVLSLLEEALTELGRRDEARRIAVELRSLGARPR